MQVKKSKKADLERFRTIFLEIGAVVALCVCLVAFEWSSEDASISSLGDLTINEDVEEEMENTIQEEQEPEEPEPEPEPEPEQIIEELVIVENDVKVDDININSEADENTATATHVAAETLIIEEEEEVEPVQFAAVEEKPEFPGGDAALLKYIAENTKYPPIAKENGVSGKVYVEFVIDKTGSVTKVSVKRGVDPALDAEAIRVVKSIPKWKPGKQRGKAVPVTYMLPINFKLN
ncbi:MAG: energy transducer TonB [Bacteroidales bacterium]|nr:energy transducer TonB [Bacteroidales bacterium]